MINLCAIQPRFPDSRYFFWLSLVLKKGDRTHQITRDKRVQRRQQPHEEQPPKRRLGACVYSVGGSLLRRIGGGAQRWSLLAFNLQGSITSLWPENERVTAISDTHTPSLLVTEGRFFNNKERREKTCRTNPARSYTIRALTSRRTLALEILTLCDRLSPF